MSIKIDQRLDDNIFTEQKPRIFTTGAFLVPMEIKKNNKKRYIWVVDEFNDDTYNEDGICITPILYACSKEEILQL